MRSLADLPNREGFQFIGITKNGVRLACIVSRLGGQYRATDCGTGEPVYGNLIGWEGHNDTTHPATAA